MNTQYILLKCRPGARFHFGLVGLDENTALNDTRRNLPSDTLFSAIVHNVDITAPQHTNAVVEAFRAGEVLISSGFLCMADAQSTVFFLPKPTHYSLHAPPHNPKAFRQIRYISRGVWERGSLPKDWFSSEYVQIQHEFLVTRSELSGSMNAAKNQLKLYELDLLPRVNAREKGAENSHYYVAHLGIADNQDLMSREGVAIVPDLGVHWYFLLRHSNDFPQQHAAVWQALQTALQLLPDMGIGGERSAGCGLFEGIEMGDFPAMRAGKSQDAQASISLAWPSSADDLAFFAHYETELRGGRETASDGPLHLVRMMREGAVQVNGSASGGIADVANAAANIPYLRYGKVFNLPVTY